jgi:hypothetical protein
VPRGWNCSKKRSISDSLIEAMSCSPTAWATFSSIVSASRRTGALQSSRNCSADAEAAVSPSGSARWVTASQASCAISASVSSKLSS